MHAGVKESSEERGTVFRPQQQTFLVIQKRKFNWKIESARVQCRSSSRRECRLDERREKKLQWSNSGNLTNTDLESFLLKHRQAGDVKFAWNKDCKQIRTFFF